MLGGVLSTTGSIPREARETRPPRGTALEIAGERTAGQHAKIRWSNGGGSVSDGGGTSSNGGGKSVNGRQHG